MSRKPIPKKLRELVYKKYDGHCAYCGCKLEMKDMQCDHILSVYINELRDNKDINTLDNLMPSCRACNYYKDINSIEVFRKSLQTLMSRVKKPFIYRLADKYNMVEEKEWDGKFYFEKVEDEKNKELLK